MSEQTLTVKQQLECVGIGVLIAVTYTVWFIVIFDDNQGFLGIFIIPDAHAQIEQREIELRQVRDLEDCTKKYVSGASAFTPFTLKVWYDTTQDYKAEIVTQSRSFPVLQQTPQVMTFHTNYTDQYQIVFDINYQESRDRQIFIQYLSQGSQVQTEQEHYSGNKYCTQFIVHTGVAPQVPTREEMFGDAYKFFGMIPVLIDGFNQNSLTVSASITYMWMIIAGIVGVFVFMVVQNSVDKKKFKGATDKMNDFIPNASKILDDFDKKMTKFEGMSKGIMLNQQEILKFQEEEAKNIEEMAQEKERIEGAPTESITAKVEKPMKDFTSKVLDLKNIIKHRKEEKKEQEKMKIEVTEDIVEVKQETTTITEDEIKERMSNKIMNIVNSIDIKTKEANFKEFSYEELNEAYAWVTNKMKVYKLKHEKDKDEESKNNTLERIEKMAIIQKILHAGSRRRWEVEHPDQGKLD